jgi:hypothetical protein
MLFVLVRRVVINMKDGASTALLAAKEKDYLVKLTNILSIAS